MHRLAWAALLAGIAISGALVESSCSDGACSDCGDAAADAFVGSACNSAGVAVCTRAQACGVDGSITLIHPGDTVGFGNGGAGILGGCEFYYGQGCSLDPDASTFDAEACLAVASSLPCGDGGLPIPDECHEPQH